jgi:hypothetical protein
MNTPNPSPSISTTDYQFSHGHAPRGIGGWLFFLGPRVAFHADNYLERVIMARGTYRDCKAKAIQMARLAGVTEIVVCP